MERENILSRIAGLAKTPTEDLKKLWLELFEKEAPPFNRSFLEARIAYRLQELAFGGITETIQQKLKAKKNQDYPGSGKQTYRPPVGTIIVKEHRGIQHRVRALHDGFEYEGLKYTSLSAVAKKISGHNCSGVKFFGFKGGRQRI